MDIVGKLTKFTTSIIPPMITRSIGLKGHVKHGHFKIQLLTVEPCCILSRQINQTDISGAVRVRHMDDRGALSRCTIVNADIYIFVLIAI